MKRMITLLLSAMMMLFGIVCAETISEPAQEAQILPLGEITLIEEGMLIDLDMDGEADSINLEIIRDEDGYDCGYSLTVNGQEAVGEGWAMDTNVYALKLQEYHGTLLMVSDCGPSDDYCTYFYLYEEDYVAGGSVLLYAGMIPSLPEMMKVNGEYITTSVRANVLCTWYRDADFALARSMGYEEPLCAQMYEVPRYLYSMEIIAALNVDIPLINGMDGDEYSAVLFEDEKVILCATDDREWVLLESLENGTRGWMQLEGDAGYECIIGDAVMFSDEVFSGLPFAD